MQVPTVTKVVVNMGVGDAARDNKADRRRRARPGHHHRPKPQVTKARKSIAPVQTAARGQPIGAHTTLRGDRMWEFLDRLMSVALPASVTSAVCRRGSSTAGQLHVRP